MSYVVFVECGRIFEECIHDVSEKVEIHPYDQQVYILTAAADDLKPLWRPLQMCENQPLRGGQILLRDKEFYLRVERSSTTR